MALFSANGGSVTVIGIGDAGANVTFDVTEWSIPEGNRVSDVSTSAQNYSKFLGTLEDNSWSFSLPMDIDNAPNDYPDFVAGSSGLTIYFKVGNTAFYHKIADTTVNPMNDQNNNAGDAFRMTVSGQGGTLTRYVAAPA